MYNTCMDLFMGIDIRGFPCSESEVKKIKAQQPGPQWLDGDASIGMIMGYWDIHEDYPLRS